MTGANADGYTDSGTVEGGSTTEIAASTTASGGMGGLGAGGGGMPAGQGGDVQRAMRGGAGSGFAAERRRSQHPFQRRPRRSVRRGRRFWREVVGRLPRFDEFTGMAQILQQE